LVQPLGRQDMTVHHDRQIRIIPARLLIASMPLKAP
jgi:hypothetical protein